MAKKQASMTREEILYHRLLIHFSSSGNLDDYTEEQKEQFKSKVELWLKDHKEYWDIVDICTTTIHDFIVENKDMDEPTPLLYKIMDVIFKDIIDYNE